MSSFMPLTTGSSPTWGGNATGVISSSSSPTIQITNSAGSSYNLSYNGSELVLHGDVKIDGNLLTNGSISAAGDIVAYSSTGNYTPTYSSAGPTTSDTGHLEMDAMESNPTPPVREPPVGHSLGLNAKLSFKGSCMEPVVVNAKAQLINDIKQRREEIKNSSSHREDIIKMAKQIKNTDNEWVPSDYILEKLGEIIGEEL